MPSSVKLLYGEHCNSCKLIKYFNPSSVKSLLSPQCNTCKLVK